MRFLGSDIEIFIPSILKPNFDLFGFNVRENGALPNELLATNGAGFGAVVIEPLQGFDLLRRVADILAIVEVRWLLTILAGHCHLQIKNHHNSSQIPTKEVEPKNPKWGFSSSMTSSSSSTNKQTNPSTAFFPQNLI